MKVRFEVTCAGSGADDLADAVRSAWDWCAVDTATEALAGDARHGLEHEVQHEVQRVTVALEQDPALMAQTQRSSALAAADLPTVMDRLSPLVTRLAVTERRRDLVMFHACAVADPETGHAVVLYGPSGTGKTTLARTLCTDLVYLSDETAGVDDELRVVPYLKPLSVLARPHDPLKEQVSPGRLGLVRPDGRDYRLVALVQLCRRPEHVGEAVLDPLSTVEALPELVAQTSYTREMDRPLHRLAGIAARVGGVHRATYAESEQLRPVVRGLLDASAGTR